MPITGPIPLPGLPGESFFQGAKDTQSIINSILENRLNPSKQKLMEAQAQEHSSKAGIQNILNSLMQGDLSGNTQNINQNSSPQLNGEALNSISNQKPGESYVISPQDFSIKNNNQQVNQSVRQPANNQKIMEWMERLGYLNPTAQDKAALDIKTNFSKQLADTDIKQIGKWNDAITASREMEPVLNNIQESIANPVFQDMYKNPEYLGYDIAYLKRFGTPQQQELLSKVAANSKSIYQTMGQEFKGAFREFEKKLFDKVAVDEVNDTLPQMKAKVDTMMQLRQLMTQRLSLADNIFRSSNGQISPSNAQKIASEQIGEKQVIKEIEDKYNKLVKEQEHLRKNNSEKINNNEENEVELYNPKGNLIGTISKEKSDAFLKAHKGYYRKEMKNE